jgi:hypothetical protein
LPRDRRILVYCEKDQRGYLAACTLTGGGFAQARLNGF